MARSREHGVLAVKVMHREMLEAAGCTLEALSLDEVTEVADDLIAAQPLIANP